MALQIHRRSSSSPPASLPPTLHPKIQEIYLNRGITSDADINYNLDQLLAPATLKGIDSAIAVLQEALIQQQRVLIVGDFDVDGATSSALAVLALRAFGFRYVDYVVPNRFHFGYGLSAELVEFANIHYQPSLIITVDNGIANLEGVAKAKQFGIKVLITDHHLPGDELPNADAIVNPNQPGCEFISKACAGVGVIFYLMVALRKFLREVNWFKAKNISEPNLANYLDLVALGTIADVVPLDKNNRVLVQQGLMRIRCGNTRHGIKALLNVAGRDFKTIQASDLGFAIGPRLNAAGRLDDMSLGIACLLTEDSLEAQAMADELNTLNKERKLIEKSMCDEALGIMQKIFSLRMNLQNLPQGICLFDPTWHQGVIGILASRLKDKFHRPVIAFAAVSETEAKGSARSIPGMHIRDVLADVGVLHPELQFKFGGHAMAAGLTIQIAKLKAFEEAFLQRISEKYSEEVFQAKIMTDGELTEDELSLEMAYLLRNAGPFGQHFPEPCFDGEFVVLKHQWLGEQHLKLLVQHGKQIVEAIVFNVDASLRSYKTFNKVKLVYQVDINNYRGVETVQLLVSHIERLA